MIAICHYLLSRGDESPPPSNPRRRRRLVLPRSPDPRSDDGLIDFDLLGKVQPIRVKSDGRR